MTASKRKNDAFESTMNNLTKMVIVNNNDDDDDKENSNNNDDEWMASTMDRMKQLRAQWENQNSASMMLFGSPNGITKQNHNDDDDPITKAICTINQVGDEQEVNLMEKARQVTTQLDEEIQHAKDLCDQESSVLTELATQLAKFQEQRQQLLREIEVLDDTQRISQGKIAMYQEEASQELEVVNDLEEQKKRQVPRLKTTISLYASTTGIKWDFTDPDLLSGQVVSCFVWFVWFAVFLVVV
jgi:hypothetical protein